VSLSGTGLLVPGSEQLPRHLCDEDRDDAQQVDLIPLSLDSRSTQFRSRGLKGTDPGTQCLEEDPRHRRIFKNRREGQRRQPKRRRWLYVRRGDA